MAEPTPEGPPAEDDHHPGFGPCYRHPGRDSAVRCARCARPICPGCMVVAPVGFQCRQCVRGAAPVARLRELQARPVVTMALIAANVAAFLPSLVGSAGVVGGNVLAGELALFGPAVAAGEWWRLVTSGFLHYGLGHLAFNLLALWFLGSSLEPALGAVRFAALYGAGLLGGALGALLLSPDAFTAGASGAVFGLMGAAVVGQHRRGIDPWRSGIGTLLLVNLLITFAVPGISVGGHVGGLLGGAAAAAAGEALDRAGRPSWSGTAAALVVGVSAAAAAVALV